jgi:hypothetical protein
MHRLFAPEPIEKATQFEIVGRRRSTDEEAMLQLDVAYFPQHFPLLVLQEIARLSLPKKYYIAISNI